MKSDPSSNSPASPMIAEVKYSLALLLEEIKTERAAGAFGLERLDRQEIAKLFKNKTRRAKRKK